MIHGHSIKKIVFQMSALFNAGNKQIKMAKHTNTLIETAQIVKLRKKKLVRRIAMMSKLT